MIDNISVNSRNMRGRRIFLYKVYHTFYFLATVRLKSSEFEYHLAVLVIVVIANNVNYITVKILIFPTLTTRAISGIIDSI